jgi:hypothetical protein
MSQATLWVPSVPQISDDVLSRDGAGCGSDYGEQEPDRQQTCRQEVVVSLEVHEITLSSLRSEYSSSLE